MLTVVLETPPDGHFQQVLGRPEKEKENFSMDSIKSEPRTQIPAILI